MPHLSKAKRGYVTQSCLIEVVNAILYKLKTGCQWAFLPVEALFSGKVLSYGAVYHHYNKWSKSGEWKSMWVRLLDKHRHELDMSSVDLDGSHTAALRGGEEVGYQGRKKRKTANALYLTDRQGLPIAMSSPKSGEHHDVHDIEKGIGDMFNDFEKSHIRVDGLFLNADAGFDCDVLRGFLCEKEIIANICINKRRENADDIFVDDELYAERYSIERTNAWMDSFRTLLNRFDTTVSSWMSWNLLGICSLVIEENFTKTKSLNHFNMFVLSVQKKWPSSQTATFIVNLKSNTMKNTQCKGRHSGRKSQHFGLGKDWFITRFNRHDKSLTEKQARKRKNHYLYRRFPNFIPKNKPI